MSYQVTIEPTGEQIEVEEGQTILQAALRQGVWLPFACGHGTCATCKVQVLEGDVDLGAASSFALMDIERDEAREQLSRIADEEHVGADGFWSLR